MTSSLSPQRELTDRRALDTDTHPARKIPSGRAPTEYDTVEYGRAPVCRLVRHRDHSMPSQLHRPRKPSRTLARIWPD